MGTLGGKGRSYLRLSQGKNLATDIQLNVLLTHSVAQDPPGFGPVTSPLPLQLCSL